MCEVIGTTTLVYGLYTNNMAACQQTAARQAAKIRILDLAKILYISPEDSLSSKNQHWIDG